MPKLPGIRHQDAVRVFEKLGYRIIRQSGHIVMSNGETRLVISARQSYRPVHHGGHCARCPTDTRRISQIAVSVGCGDKDVQQAAEFIKLK